MVGLTAAASRPNVGDGRQRIDSIILSSVNVQSPIATGAPVTGTFSELHRIPAGQGFLVTAATLRNSIDAITVTNPETLSFTINRVRATIAALVATVLIAPVGVSLTPAGTAVALVVDQTNNLLIEQDALQLVVVETGGGAPTINQYDIKLDGHRIDRPS